MIIHLSGVVITSGISSESGDPYSFQEIYVVRSLKSYKAATRSQKAYGFRTEKIKVADGLEIPQSLLSDISPIQATEMELEIDVIDTWDKVLKKEVPTRIVTGFVF